MAVRTTFKHPVANYSVTNEATPIALGETSGAIGTFTFDTRPFEDAEFEYGGSVEIEDTLHGTVSGTIQGVSSTPEGVSFLLDNPMRNFNTTHSVLPFVGTLEAAMEYYMTVVDIDTALLNIDPTLGATQVVNPGWNGNVWDGLRDFLLANQWEIAFIDGEVVVREIRQETILTQHLSNRSVDVGNLSAARTLDVLYYNNVYEAQGEIYAPDDGTTYSVDANERLEVEVQLTASVISVNQPECLEEVEDRSYANSNGVYAVNGSDDRPISPERWAAYGGDLRVETTDDPSVIKIIIKGSSEEAIAPFQIIMNAGNGSTFNSLHITGEAVQRNVQSLTMSTGMPPGTTGADSAPVIDNIFVSDRSTARNVGQWAAIRYSGVSLTGGASVAKSERDFGDIVGARYQDKYRMMRVNTMSGGPEGLSITVAEDTTMADLTTAWSGMTGTEFYNIWNGQTMNDFYMSPMRSE